jgi:hypothetical protein
VEPEAAREVWVTLKLRTTLPLHTLARRARWMHADAELTGDGDFRVLAAEAEEEKPRRRKETVE